MGIALKLDDQLNETTDVKRRNRHIADVFEELETRYPNLSKTATQGDVRESELCLKPEIGKVRKEITESEVRLAQTIHGQTWRMIGGLTILGVVLKLVDLFLK